MERWREGFHEECKTYQQDAFYGVDIQWRLELFDVM